MVQSDIADHQTFSNLYADSIKWYVGLLNFVNLNYAWQFSFYTFQSDSQSDQMEENFKYQVFAPFK